MTRNLLAICAMASLSACASNYVAKPYVAGAQPIGKIAVMDDSMPEKMSAVETASVGSNFGLIGALIDAGVTASRQDALSDALATVSFDAEDRLEKRVVEALAAQGMEATLVKGPLRQKRVFLNDYPAAPDGTRAYLDLVLTNYGYTSAGSGQPWRPTAYAMVKLVSASNKKTLLENHIAYNVMHAPRGVITLTPHPDYVFKNREEMKTQPDRLAAGLEDAFTQIAATAANLMR